MNMRNNIVLREQSKTKVANICELFYFVSFESKRGCNRKYLREPRFCYPDPNWFTSLKSRPRGWIKNSINICHKAKNIFERWDKN